MRTTTRDLWARQNQHDGDRQRLFRAVGQSFEATSVLYSGSYVDVAASCVWPSVTYIDSDGRAATFFDDTIGVREIIAVDPLAPSDPQIRFLAGDYTEDLGLADESFDLLVSMYAGFVSEHCTRYLRVGGLLLVNPSHGDAALASIDDRYQLTAVVRSRSGVYSVMNADLDSYLVPKKPTNLTSDFVHRRGRGIAYTKSPFAYVFRRVR